VKVSPVPNDRVPAKRAKKEFYFVWGFVLFSNLFFIQSEIVSCYRSRFLTRGAVAVSLYKELGLLHRNSFAITLIEPLTAYPSMSSRTISSNHATILNEDDMKFQRVKVGFFLGTTRVRLATVKMRASFEIEKKTPPSATF
jgi:hypothetical protein